MSLAKEKNNEVVLHFKMNGMGSLFANMQMADPFIALEQEHKDNNRVVWHHSHGLAFEEMEHIEVLNKAFFDKALASEQPENREKIKENYRTRAYTMNHTHKKVFGVTVFANRKTPITEEGLYLVDLETLIPKTDKYNNPIAFVNVIRKVDTVVGKGLLPLPEIMSEDMNMRFMEVSGQRWYLSKDTDKRSFLTVPCDASQNISLRVFVFNDILEGQPGALSAYRFASILENNDYSCELSDDWEPSFQLKGRRAYNRVLIDSLFDRRFLIGDDNGYSTCDTTYEIEQEFKIPSKFFKVGRFQGLDEIFIFIKEDRRFGMNSGAAIVPLTILEKIRQYNYESAKKNLSDLQNGRGPKCRDANDPTIKIRKQIAADLKLFIRKHEEYSDLKEVEKLDA